VDEIICVESKRINLFLDLNVSPDLAKALNVRPGGNFEKKLSVERTIKLFA
jgi:hypothetical protein